jgi:hypothetical protein
MPCRRVQQRVPAIWVDLGFVSEFEDLRKEPTSSAAV